MKSYSQYKQDMWLSENVFKNIDNGFFVEIGAHNGIQNSNTKHFEEVGWTGICIEPSPSRFQELVNNRSCHCENVALYDTEGTVQFMDIFGYSNQLSGIVNAYDARMMSRIKRELNRHPDNRGYKIEHIKCTKLNTVLQKYDVRHVDFCSIDAEGAEMNILRGVDFSFVEIDVFMIENNYNDSDVKNFLTDHGYIKKHSIRQDDIYTRD
jgi:FkbM family methyltransferase